MSDVFVGIVEGTPPFTITVGVVQDDGLRVTANSFAVQPAHLYEYYVPQPDGAHRYTMPADLFGVANFLNESIPPDSHVRYLVEVPETVPDPPNDIGAVPHPVLPTQSVILKLLVLLGVNGVICAPFRTDPQVQTAVLFPIVRGSELQHLLAKSPRYLPRGVCKAYGELLGLTCERAEHVALVGALVAKNPGAFHYWSSIGLVQSSMDVLSDLRAGVREPTRVLSASEHYVTEYTDATVHTALEDVPLEYAVAQNRYAHLGYNDALKAALIRVCQQWRIGLRCSSTRDDADDPGAEHAVYPLGSLDSIVIGALQHAERAQIWPENPHAG
jgi:hypothetical protein